MNKYVRLMTEWRNDLMPGILAYLPLNQPHIRCINSPDLCAYWFVHHRPQ